MAALQGVRRNARVGLRLARELAAVAETTSLSCSAKYFAGLARVLPEVMRVRSLAPADARMRGTDCTFGVLGTEVVLPGALFGSARELYCRRVYFALPDFRIDPQDVVVDVGADHGVFTTLAARLGRRVLAIEAQSLFCSTIGENVRRNGCEGKVVVEQALVGGGTGIFADDRRLSSSSHYELPPPRLSMGEILARHDIRCVDFMKIDIEGSEFDLLRQNTEWLDLVGKMVLEVHTEFGDPRELVDLLSRRGFVTSLFDDELRSTTERFPKLCGYLYARRARRH